MEQFYCVGKETDSVEILKGVNVNNDTTDYIMIDDEVTIRLNHIGVTLKGKIHSNCEYITASHLLTKYYEKLIILQEDTFITMGLEYGKDNE